MYEKPPVSNQSKKDEEVFTRPIIFICKKDYIFFKSLDPIFGFKIFFVKILARYIF